MNTREVAYKYRLNQWTAIIRECRTSGQTIKAWCLENQINQKSYYYWLKRVRAAACEALPALNADNNTIVPVNLVRPTAGQSQAESRNSAALIMRLGPVTLEIGNSASATLIENTLKALQYVR